ncbi:hypothetical protein ACF09Y_34330 [Streptomyces massasporeus]|uniref:hypothetical protein n=1 Tax=Streptomyces massasporeus TaxID=67324 RepID=UPI0036FD9B7C
MLNKAHSSRSKPVVRGAKSKQSGAQHGITSGKICQQYTVVASTLGKMPPVNAKCARASMPQNQNQNQNEGVGGDLGRFTNCRIPPLPAGPNKAGRPAAVEATSRNPTGQHRDQ